MVLKYLIEKEFKQMRRNPIIPRLILVFPCMMMILMPWAANLEIKYNNLAVVDLDHSALSRRLVEKVASTDYFNLVENAPDYGRALESVEGGEADVILEIPRDFAKSLGTGRPVELQISANSINGTKGGLGSSYLSTVVNDFVNQELGGTGMARLSVLNLYNPHLNYKVFMVPALLIMMLTLLCGFLPALNIVSEKEVGTIEQLNVTPLNKFVFILAKLVPYWIVGLVVLSIGLGLSAVLYGIVPSGSLWLIYFFSCIYILTIGFRTDYFQLFRHDAAGHVRHVFLPDGIHPDERPVHPRAQHAGLGAVDSGFQSVDLFYSGHAYDFPEGMWADRLVAAVRQDAVFHVGVCRSSRVELPEDKCLIARAGHVWRWMACRMIYKTKPWGVFGL